VTGLLAPALALAPEGSLGALELVCRDVPLSPGGLVVGAVAERPVAAGLVVEAVAGDRARAAVPVGAPAAVGRALAEGGAQLVGRLCERVVAVALAAGAELLTKDPVRTGKPEGAWRGRPG
jgi:hypothetical protein